MLGLFGKKSDHPMADLQSAMEMLEDLPKSDALKALQELSSWLESMCSDESIRLDNRFAVLRLLDETARPFERKLMREYFSPVPLAKFQENRLWTALNDFFENLGHAYYEVLSGYRNGEKGASAIKSEQPLIVARGIYVTMCRLKNAAVHYTSVDTELWGQLAEYYAQAESQHYLDEAVELYPGMGANSSVRRQCASALLWWASGTGSLRPLQIHLSERLTAYLCHNLTMDSQPGADSLLSFDLTQSKSPLRFTGDNSAHPNLRFIGLGKVQAQLETLIQTLETGAVSDELNLGGTYEAEVVCEVAKRLASGWLSAPPVRRNVRHNVSVKLSVAKGYAGLIDHTAAGMNFSDMEGVETWEAEDISATGFRCSLESAHADWVKVGTLIGYRPENVQRWGAGIVRRLRRDDQSKLDIGVEILANHVEGVLLRGSSGVVRGEDAPAMWLAAAAEDAEARLLTRPDAFADNRTLQMRAGGKQYLLMPLERKEKGEDYDLMRCRKVVQEAASNGEGY